MVNGGYIGQGVACICGNRSAWLIVHGGEDSSLPKTGPEVSRSKSSDSPKFKRERFTVPSPSVTESPTMSHCITAFFPFNWAAAVQLVGPQKRSISPSMTSQVIP